MTQTTRLEEELADALGLLQVVRGAACAALERVERPKLRRRLEQADAELAGLQDRTNALVVAQPATRTRLIGRSRRVREGEQTALSERPDGADALDALQALAAESAYLLAQWKVVRRLAKAARRDDALELARDALPLAERHLAIALRGCDKVAKRQARQLVKGA